MSFPNQEKKIYHDPKVKQKLTEADKFKLWIQLDGAVMGYCDGEECGEGKTTVKRYGLIHLCRTCFYRECV